MVTIDNLRQILGFDNITNEDFIRDYPEIVVDGFKEFGICKLKGIPDCDISTVTKLSDIINWRYISHYVRLNSQDIDKYALFLDWSRVCKYQKGLTLKLIEKYKSMVVWISLFSNTSIFLHLFGFGGEIPITFLDDYWDYISKDKDAITLLSVNFKIPIDFLDSHFSYFPSSIISRYQELSVEFIKSHVVGLKVGYILRYQESIFINDFYKEIIRYNNNSGFDELRKNQYLSRRPDKNKIINWLENEKYIRKDK